MVDHAYYDIPDWAAEVLATACPGLDASVELRSGRPSDEILAVASEQTVDLIVLEWSQEYRHGHGQVVAEVLGRSPVPALLFPASTDPNASA